MLIEYETTAEFEENKAKIKDETPIHIYETNETMMKIDGEWIPFIEEEVHVL
jgi:hypothetical protein